MAYGKKVLGIKFPADIDAIILGAFVGLATTVIPKVGAMISDFTKNIRVKLGGDR